MSPRFDQNSMKERCFCGNTQTVQKKRPVDTDHRHAFCSTDGRRCDGVCKQLDVRHYRHLDKTRQNGDGTCNTFRDDCRPDAWSGSAGLAFILTCPADGATYQLTTASPRRSRRRRIDRPDQDRRLDPLTSCTRRQDDAEQRSPQAAPLAATSRSRTVTGATRRSRRSRRRFRCRGVTGDALSDTAHLTGGFTSPSDSAGRSRSRSTAPATTPARRRCIRTPST